MTSKPFGTAAARQAFETALHEQRPDFEVFFLSRLYGLEFSYTADTCVIRFPVHDFMFNPQGSLHGGVRARRRHGALAEAHVGHAGNDDRDENAIFRTGGWT